MGRTFSLGIFLAGLLVLTVAPSARAQAVITYVDTENNSTSYDTTSAPNNPLTLTITTGSAEQSGVLSGSGSVIKTGAGTLTLSGSNSYSGGTTVSAGTLAMTNSSALGYGSVTISSGATVDASSGTPFSFDLSRLSGPGTLTTSSGTSYIFNGQSLDHTVDTILAGNAVVGSYMSTGTLTLTGANTYTGWTQITSGTVSVSSDTNLGAAPTGGPSPTGFVQLGDGGTLITTGSFTTDRELYLRLGTIYGGTLNTAGGTTLTWNGNISESDGAGGTLTKAGSGTLVLGGTNTYTGPTTVGAGTLQFAQEVSFYNDNPANWTATNLVVASGATVAFNVGGTGEFTSGDLDTVLAHSGGFAAGASLGLDTTNGDFAYAGGITNSTNGALGLTKLGTGILTLSGTNTYSGNTTIAAGTVQFAQEASLPNAANLIVVSGATAAFNVGAAGEFTSGDITNLLGTASFQNGTNLGLDTTNGDFAYAGNITDTSGGYNSLGLIKLGSGTLTLSGINTYSGGTTINSGSLQFAQVGSLAGGPSNLYVNSGATAAFNIGGSGEFASGDLDNVFGNMAGFQGGAIVGLDTTNAGGNFTYSGTITDTSNGSLGLTKLGSGTLTLSGANTYTGATTVNAGTLAMGNSSAVGTTGTVTIANGAILDSAFYGFDLTRLNGGGTGTLTGSGNFNYTSDNDATIATILAGSASLLKYGLGNLTLSGANTYTGGTWIYAGTLTLGNISALGTVGSVYIDSGATLNLNGYGFDISRLTGPGSGSFGASSYDYNSDSDTTVSTSLTGSGYLTKEGAGTLTLSGNNTYSGGSTIYNGTLNLGVSSIADGSDIIQGPVGTSTLTLENGTTLGVAPDAGPITLHNAIVFDSGTVTVDTTNGELALMGVITDGSDSGSLLVTGTNALSLFGQNTYSGGTEVSRGSTLLLGSSSYTPDSIVYGPVGTGGLTLDGNSTLGVAASPLNNPIVLDNNITLVSNASYPNENVVFDTTNGDLTLNGYITGNGVPVLLTGNSDNSGTLTLTYGYNDFDGGLTVHYGTLLLGASSAADGSDVIYGPVGRGTLALDYGTTLGVAPSAGDITLDNPINLLSAANIDTTNGNLTLNGVIDNTGGLTLKGGGTLTLSGANTYSGNTSVTQSSTLLLGSSTLDSDGVLTNNSALIASGPVGTGDIKLYDGSTLGVANGTGPITLANTLVLDCQTGTNVWIDTTNGNLNLTGAISGDAGLTVIGGNSLALLGDNTFSGGLTVTNGSLLLLGSSTKNSDGTVISDPGQINSGPVGTGTLTLNDGAILSTAGVGDMTLANNVILSGSSGVTLQLSQDHTPDGGLHYYYDSLTLGGTLSGSAPINLYGNGNSQDGYHGGGNLYLQGDNSGWIGGLNIYGNDFVGVYNQNGLGTGPLWINPAGSATVEFTTGNPIIGGLSGGHSGVDYHSTVMVDDGTTVTINQNATGTFDGIIAGTGNINKDGGAQLTLTGINTYTGTTTITDGTLAVSDDSNLGTAPVSVTPGSLILSGGELEATSSFTLNANRGITLNGSGGFFTDNGATLTYNGVIDGSGRLTKDGAGTLVLGGLNTFDGGVTLAGVLSISDDANLGLAPGSPTANDLRLGNGTIESTATLTLNANRGILLDDAGGTFLTDPGTTLTYNGIISSLSTGGLTKSGTGTLVLGGASNYTGGTTLSEGTLAVGNASALGTGTLSVPIGASYSPTFTTTTAGLTLANPVNVTLTFGSAGVRFGGTYDFALSGALSGSGIIDKYGSDNLSLTSDNSSFTGGINVLNGTLTVGADNAGGGPLSTIGVIGSEGPATLAFTSPAPSVGTIYAYSGTNITLASGTTLTVNQTWDTNIDGTISGNGSLVKSGPNTLTLTAANTYTGGTTISAGMLVAGNNSAFGTGSLTLNGGTLGVANGITLNNSLSFTGGTPTTLGGNGTIGSHITADSHVILSPGNSPGNLGFSAGLTLASLGEYDWQLQSVAGAPLSGAGTNWDLVSVSGSTLDLPTTGNFTLKVISLNAGGTAGSVSDFNPGSAYTWTIATSTSGITGGVGNITIDTSQFANQPGSTGFSLSISGNDLNLNFSPVPEPSTYALMALGLSVVVLPIIRRRQRSS